jgi:flagellar hook-length control protein FliK
VEAVTPARPETRETDEAGRDMPRIGDAQMTEDAQPAPAKEPADKLTTSGVETLAAANAETSAGVEQPEGNVQSGPATHASTASEPAVAAPAPVVTDGGAAPVTTTRAEAMPQVESSESTTPEEAISKATLRALADGEREFTVQLDPPSLGRVRVVLRETASGFQAAIEAEREETQRLVAAGIDVLRTTLRDNGITVRELDVRADTSSGRGWEDGSREGSASASTYGDGQSEARHRGASAQDARTDLGGEYASSVQTSLAQGARGASGEGLDLLA